MMVRVLKAMGMKAIVVKSFNIPDKDDGDDDNDSDEGKDNGDSVGDGDGDGDGKEDKITADLTLAWCCRYIRPVMMVMVIKAMVINKMSIKAFNVPDKVDGDDDNDGDEGEENGDGDGNNEEDKSTAVLMLARRRWLVRPDFRDGDSDKSNDDEDDDNGDGDGDRNTGGGDGATEQVTMVNGLLVFNDSGE